MKIKHIFIIVLGALVLYPITGIIQILPFTDATPYTAYKEFMEPVINFIVNNFSWIVISLISFVVIFRLPEVMYDYQEEIRKRQYYFERLRWESTPYIPPLLLYYMLCPPVSFSQRKGKQAHNEFYPLLVRDFQNRVAINSSFTTPVPKKRSSEIKVVGFKIISIITMHYIALIFILSMASGTNAIEFFTQTGAKFLIPVIIHIVGYTSAVIMAIGKTAVWRFTENKLKVYFSEEYLHHEPRIAWIDILPDTHTGYGIIKMWERDCFRRIQLTYEMKGKTIPNDVTEIKWDNPTIPGNPFPETLDMSWVPRAREHVQAVHSAWQKENEINKYEAIKESKNKPNENGQVIDIYQQRSSRK